VIAKHTKLVKSRGTVLDRVLSLASQVRHEISHCQSVEATGSRLVILGPLDTLRAVASLNPSDATGKSAKAILLRACYQAEQKSTMGAACLIESLCSDDLPSTCKQLQKADYENFLGLLGSDSLKSLVSETISAAGPQATVNVKETEKQTYSLILDSIDIPVSPIGEFGSEVVLGECRVLSYDGVIERVSEINAIAERCSSENSALVIYARGFGYEVVATLLHNWRTKRLRILPVSAKSDDMQNFWFCDLPQLLTFSPVENSLRNYENLRISERVTLSSGILSISDKEISMISSKTREKISKESEDIGVEKNWVDERIRRLSSRKVEISIGNDYASSKGIVKDRVGTAVRYLTSARSRGVVNRAIFGRDILVPVVADITGREVAESLRKELQTSTLVVSDDGLANC